MGIIKRAALFAFAGIIFSKLFAYIYRLILSRLGPDAYGLFSLAFGIFGFLIIFSLVGMHSGVERFIALYRAKKDKAAEQSVLVSAVSLVVVTSLFFSVLLYVSSHRLSIYFHNPGLELVLKIFSFGLPFATLTLLFVFALKSLGNSVTSLK